MKIRKAVIPAAGWGTRLLPATKAQPKEMLPIIDKPTIQYVVEEAVHSGVEEILIISNYGKRAIENHFTRSPRLEDVLKNKGNAEMLELVRKISDMAKIRFARQKEPLGLGHAVYCARRFVGHEPFAVLLGDDIVVEREPRTHAENSHYHTNPGRDKAGFNHPHLHASCYHRDGFHDTNHNDHFHANHYLCTSANPHTLSFSFAITH